MDKEYKYYWNWKEKPPGRKGQWCRVLARGKMNSCLVKYEDGYKCITSRNGLRKIKNG